LGDNNKIDNIDTGCEGVVWIQLVQSMVQLWAFVNMEMNLSFPQRWEVSWSA